MNYKKATTSSNELYATSKNAICLLKRTRIGIRKDQIKIFEGIGSNSSIFSISSAGHILFKHNKVTDNLLSLSISRMLSDIPKNSEALSELYYAELIGKALAGTQGKLLNDSCNCWLLEVLPLAVVESLYPGRKY